MIIDGKEVNVKKKPFAMLKKNVCDDAKNLQDMIKRTDSYEEGMDSVINTRDILKIMPENSNRSMFTSKTVASVVNGFKGRNQNENVRKENSEDEYYR